MKAAFLRKETRRVWKPNPILLDNPTPATYNAPNVGDVAKQVKAGVCKTPIAGSSPAVASAKHRP